MRMIDLIEFQFDLIGNEILAWKTTLEWLYDGRRSTLKKLLDIASFYAGWRSAVKKLVDIALVRREE